MTRDEILAAAREAGIPDDNIPALAWGRLETGKELLERFATIIERKAAEAEREACALECERIERAKWESVKEIGSNGGRIAFAGPMHCATAIRARNNPTAGVVPASES